MAAERRWMQLPSAAGAGAAVLGVPEQPGVPLAGAVARVLAGQQLLLVLTRVALSAHLV